MRDSPFVTTDRPRTRAKREKKHQDRANPTSVRPQEEVLNQRELAAILQTVQNISSARLIRGVFLVLAVIVLRHCSTMKTTTVRERRNNYARVLKWVSSGQEVQVTRRGKVVAKVVPPAGNPQKIDWSLSAALNRPLLSRTLTAKKSGNIIAESQGT
jgi:antitoxin (DNA-binding transcriptional repressor) of toxin-antitoxin stability system